MINSLYKNRTAIYFGTGMEDAGLTELARLGARHVLLHYGQGSVTRSGLLDRVMAGLTARQIAVTELGGVKPNPTLPRVREGVALCRARGIDTLLAVGGGSVNVEITLVGVTGIGASAFSFGAPSLAWGIPSLDTALAYL